MNLKEKLFKIQGELISGKTQYNSFGKYKYRSLESIIESAKDLLKETKTILTMSDDIVNIGDRFYIKATATLTDCESDEEIMVTAYAREEESKKGMDASQLTGSTSSYARKYALNGLFAIDDTKDADTLNSDEEYTKRKTEKDKQQNKTTEKTISQAQTKRLYTISTEANITDDDVRKMIKKAFGKNSTKELIKTEYDFVIERLQKKIENDKVEQLQLIN